METGKKNYTVFIVEDSDVYRSLLVHALESESESAGPEASFSIYDFPSGEKCLQYLHLEPDIIVLDYFLNGNGYVYNMDGLSVLSRIKKFLPETDVIIVSCQQSIEIARQFMSAGIKEYIKKEGMGQYRLKKTIRNLIHEKKKKKNVLKLLRNVVSVTMVIIISAILIWLFKQ